MERTIFDLQPTLEDRLLLLRPLATEDFEGLYEVAADPLVWEQHPAKNRCERDVFELFFADAMLSGGAFAVIDKHTGKIIGSTRFHRVKESENAIEIGWTFLARKYWGGRYNKSMKQLMIDWALQFVDNILFYIDENNIRSQKAVEKIGGERITAIEGTPLDVRPNAAVTYNIIRKQWMQSQLRKNS
jgi:RimJ/RimL family protein N-acetyltransferase